MDDDMTRALLEQVRAGDLSPEDAARLLAGRGPMEEGASAVLAQAAGRAGHIFNLGHGIPPGADPSLVRALVDFVHERSSRWAVDAG